MSLSFILFLFKVSIYLGRVTSLTEIEMLLTNLNKNIMIQFKF